jgi:hypothetical protein
VPGEDKEKVVVSSSLDVDKLLYYLQHFYLESSRPSHVFGEEDSGAPAIPMGLHAPTHDVQEQTLVVLRGEAFSFVF